MRTRPALGTAALLTGVISFTVIGCGSNENNDGGTQDLGVASDLSAASDLAGSDGALAADGSSASDGALSGDGGAALTQGQVLQVMRSIDQAEIAQAQLAQGKAVNIGVKTFATRMVTEHQAAEGRITALATTLGVTLADSPLNQQVVTQGQQELQMLMSFAAGTQFDQGYIAAQATGHQQALQIIDASLIPSSTASSLLNYLVQGYRPDVVAHLSSAQSIQSILTITPSLTDAQILGAVNIANQSEIAAGNAAVAEGQSAAVLQFANMMVTAHTAVATQIAQLAAQLGVSTSTQSASSLQIAAEAQATTNNLNQASAGPQFDRVYIDSQVNAHLTLLTFIDTVFVPSTQTTQLTNFLQNTLRPAVLQHYASAEQIAITLTTAP